MPKFALFLRGINVGGHNRVAMSDLRALIEREGFTGVTTLLQSGNAVFTGRARPAASLESRFEKAIARDLKAECDCLVRTAAEWEALVGANPIPAAAKHDPAHLHVVLLGAKPTATAVAALRSAIKGRETIAAAGRQLYVIYPDGSGRSKLTLPLIERHLGTRGTARNWNTVLKLAELFGR